MAGPLRTLTDEAWAALQAAAVTETPEAPGGLRLPELTAEQSAELSSWSDDQVFAVVEQLMAHKGATVLQSLAVMGLVDHPPNTAGRISGRLTRDFPPSLAGAAALVEALEAQGFAAIAEAYGLSRPGLTRWAEHLATIGPEGTITRMGQALRGDEPRRSPPAPPPQRPALCSCSGRGPARATAGPPSLADRLERLGRLFPPTLQGLRALRAYRARQDGWRDLAAHVGVSVRTLQRHHAAVLAAVAEAA